MLLECCQHPKPSNSQGHRRQWWRDKTRKTLVWMEQWPYNHKKVNNAEGKMSVESRKLRDTHHGTDGTWGTTWPTRALVSRFSLFSLGSVHTWEAAVSLHARQTWHAGKATRTRGPHSTRGARGAIITIVALRKQ